MLPTLANVVLRPQQPVFSFFHQAGYSQRKEDIRSLNESISKLQEQVKRAETFVSGLQGARPVLQPFLICVFDAIAGTACCLENMCLSLVQLLQLPDCPANIVQDASRYRFWLPHIFCVVCHNPVAACWTRTCFTARGQPPTKNPPAKWSSLCDYFNTESTI